MKKKFIIFSLEQAGGIDALSPVIIKIQENKKIKSLVLLQDKDIYRYAKERGLKNLNLIRSFSKLEDILEKNSPSTIFTDTNSSSYENSLNKRIIKLAKDWNIPSACYVDCWANYKIRFGEELESVPDYVLAIDDEMRDDLGKIGIPKNIVKVFGSPRFDIFSKFKEETGKDVIVFYSETFEGKKMSEKNVFKDVIEAIEKYYPEKKIIIKFHPSREKNKNKYDHIIKKSSLTIRKVKNQEDLRKLSKKAELVIGMRSIALFDAALMGKKVISYQPGLNKQTDTLRSNTYGWSQPIYNKKNISVGIKNILEKEVPVGKKSREEYTKNKSTEKILSFIKSLSYEKK